MKSLRGSLLLLLTAVIWGMAFVAQSAAADSIGAFTFNTVRSLMAALFLALLLLGRSLWNKTAGGRAAAAAQTAEEKKARLRRTILGGVLCGAALCVAVNLQQAGIGAYPQGVAASGRSGFLTAMYVVFVALCSPLVGKKLHPIVLLSALGSMGGMYLLCLSRGFSSFYLGDGLELLCAAAFTVQILLVDRFSETDGVLLSCIQFAVCGLISAVPMLLFESVSLSVLRAAWMPILYAGVMSGGVGYTLQILGQKTAPPALASILMSMESVFAALAGWVILGERLSAVELCGCGVVFACVVLAQLGAANPPKKQTST